MSKMRLNKEVLCQARIALVAKEGLENLTVPRLANSLNIKAASLHNNVRSKSELFDLIQDY